MTRKELERKLKQLGYLDLYSLDGSVGPDRVVLYKNYAVWEVFYIDERGNRTVPKLFSSEEEAYGYLYKEAVDMYELLLKTMVRLKVKYNHQSPYKEMISK